MNPISFSCSHCSQSVTVPPDAAGRAVPCPHCKQAILVPNPASARAMPTPAKIRRGSGGDQGPDFTETLRKAREATDSIFHEQEDEGDSLFGGSDTPRRLIVPPAAATSQTPTTLADPSQPTLRVPGLPALPPIQTGSASPLATRAVYVPTSAPVVPDNPFEDLIAESSSKASGDLQADGAMVEEDEEEAEAEESPRRPFPWKNLLIAALMLYAMLMTALAAWGWLRSPDAAKIAPPSNVGKR